MERMVSTASKMALPLECNRKNRVVTAPHPGKSVLHNYMALTFFFVSTWGELPVSSSAAASTLCVTNFGARGDAFETLGGTVKGSPVVHLLSTNQFSSADVGKLLLLFGAGPASTPTNQQDLVAKVVSVKRRTEVTISAPAGITASNVRVTCGTQNASAFQRCINSCSDSNTVVQIPEGRYLLVPPVMLETNFVMIGASDAHPSVILQTGGIHFLGVDPSSSVLVGCGAWMLKGGWVHRGWMFECLAPVTNNYPLIFENLTFDGGVQQGREAVYTSGPALTNNGEGWDITHDAVVDAGGLPPLHAFKQFINCTFTHWRGEMVKSVASQMDGYIEVTNCAFLDGEASGFNFNFTHLITGCTFSNLDMAIEFYAGYMTSNSTFAGSAITNVRNAIVLVGALTNHAMPSYTITGNTMAPSQTGVLLGPARNITISSNQFIGGNIGIATDNYAYQGSGENSNVVIALNSFQNVGTPFVAGGGGEDSIVDVIVISNQAWDCGRFAEGGGWSSNVAFLGNYSAPGMPNHGSLFSQQLGGQWFLDDLSNDFPWFQVYDNPPVTDPITYANGMRQRLYPALSNSVFVIQNPDPAQIPPGAMLIIKNAGQCSCLLSNAGSGVVPAPVPMGNTVYDFWQIGAWQLGTNMPAIPPPQNLHVTQL